MFLAALLTVIGYSIDDAALFVLGGETLADFTLALLIGTTVGMYSSLFTAAPLALLLEPRAGQRRQRPRRATRRPSPATAARP